MPRHKYNAVPKIRDGIKFASTKEAEYYDKLLLAMKAEPEHARLLFFLRQVPLHLPGGTKLVIDFMEFWADGEVIFTDVKGFKTPVYKLKKREVEHHYPIKIQEV